MSWSIAHLVSHTERWAKAVVAPVFNPLVFPPMGHDLDTPVDGADQLAEREAEEEVSEPRHVQCTRCGNAYATLLGDVPSHECLRGQTEAEWLGNERLATSCTRCGDPFVFVGGGVMSEHVDGVFCSNSCRQVAEIQHIESSQPGGLGEPGLSDVVAQLAQLTYFVEDIRNLIASPAVSAGTGARGEEERTEPPNVPSSPHSTSVASGVNAADPSPTAMQRGGGEGSTGDCDIPPSPPVEHPDPVGTIRTLHNAVAVRLDGAWSVIWTLFSLDDAVHRKSWIYRDGSNTAEDIGTWPRVESMPPSPWETPQFRVGHE